MNFIKKQGERTLTINQIVAAHFNKELRSRLSFETEAFNEIESDYVNDRAELVYNNKKYPNVMYMFKAHTLKAAIEGLELLVKEFMDSCKGKKVSIRKDIEVRSYEDLKYDIDTSYKVVFRAAIIE